MDSISSGDVWKAAAAGEEATIGAIVSCPHADCAARPYVRTKPGSPAVVDLENLPRC